MLWAEDQSSSGIKGVSWALDQSALDQRRMMEWKVIVAGLKSSMFPAGLNPYGLEKQYIQWDLHRSIHSLIIGHTTRRGYISHLAKHQRGPRPVSTKHPRQRRCVRSFTKAGNQTFTGSSEHLSNSSEELQ